MPPRLHVDLPLQGPGTSLDLPPGAARHVQVLRLQPGAPLVLFDGRGGEWSASVEHMGRQSVRVRLERFDEVEREAPTRVTIAVGMPANDRMDGLVEKACELGVAAIQPLVCERSVLRLAGERAQRKVGHWQGVAVAACEQSGRTRVPTIAPVRTLVEWLAGLAMPPAESNARVVMSLRDARPLAVVMQPSPLELTSLSGPEGGLTDAEEEAARARGFVPVSLGPRVLRADTAALALLALLALTQDTAR
jgi:16S rRNA (uracil1498-N3)-methyltransferase